ncbi:hypothetical protein KBD34_05145 [Patescibacteria group bacterium]|nr:hypothetical protein [Patescibacteria group bacterium]
MDSGFLSGTTPPEAPKAPEVVPAPSPEFTPSPPPLSQEALPQEPQLEAEAVQVAPAPVDITAHEPADDQLAATPAAPAIAIPPDKVAEDVDTILKDGLEEAVAAMPEDAKQRFWQKGKEIGALVADMVRHYKVEVKRVLHLLKEWLISIPGVNRFFLEQEAKIKTDRILDLERLRHEVAPA